MQEFNLDPYKIAVRIEAELGNAALKRTDEVLKKINNALPGIINYLARDIKKEWEKDMEAAGNWGRIVRPHIKSEVAQENKKTVEATIYVDPNAKFTKEGDGERGDKKSNKPITMFADMIENGVKSWSIKDALLKSEKAKMGADGIKYITVPFPVAVPRQEDKAGSQTSQFGGRTMTKDMHQIIKSGGKISGTLTTAGDRDIDISGLTRYEDRQHHERYGIFRRVSEKSTGWQYPDIEGKNVLAGVAKYVERRIAEEIHAWCEKIKEEFSE